jgi:electron transfer flavoprotein alpha subunit
MSVLVLAEHDHASLKPSSLNAITAATKLDADVHVLIAGYNAGEAAKQASAVSGVTKVLHADSESYAHHLPEDIAPLVANIAERYSHIVSPATTYGKNISPRIAGLKDVQQISDVIEIVDASTFKRPVYAGNAIATVQSSDALKLLTIRTTGFDPAATSGGTAPIETIPARAESPSSKFIGQELTQSARPELTAAKIVISGGRGVGSAENFKLIETLADKLGAAVGASRAAVDAGYAPNDYQVGQTGKVVAPQLYIALGISGAIQHLAGMKDSKVIVAINKDPEAPIFQIADYGLVADLFQAVPELTEKL